MTCEHPSIDIMTGDCGRCGHHLALDEYPDHRVKGDQRRPRDTEPRRAVFRRQPSRFELEAHLRAILRDCEHPTDLPAKEDRAERIGYLGGKLDIIRERIERALGVDR